MLNTPCLLTMFVTSKKQNGLQTFAFALTSNNVRTQFPSTTIKILEGHDDEVWHMAFSNSGQYLASLSRDKTCIIWDMMVVSMNDSKADTLS